MTITERVAAYQRAFPENKASWPWLVREQGRDVAYAIFVIGNDYKNKVKFYGTYPPSYLLRVLALFPDVLERDVLHVFSGALPPGGYMRCDVVQPAEFMCSVYDLPTKVTRPFSLILADPPYSAEDAMHYNTGMVDRRRAMAALFEVTRPGGHCVWLDTVWPMHAKKQWLTVGRFLVQRSTNHRARICSVFERVA